MQLPVIQTWTSVSTRCTCSPLLVNLEYLNSCESWQFEMEYVKKSKRRCSKRCTSWIKISLGKRKLLKPSSLRINRHLKRPKQRQLKLRLFLISDLSSDRHPNRRFSPHLR